MDESIKKCDDGWYWADDEWYWHGPYSSRDEAEEQQFLYDARELIGIE